MDNPKTHLRQEALRHRAQTLIHKDDAEAARDLFFDVIKPHAGQIVAAYWPKDREFDTYPILQALLARGVTCALPVMQKGSRLLRFARWDEQVEMTEGPFGILQPAVKNVSDWLSPDIVIVPLLAFDRRGHRLGYGGGYYDTTLANLRAEQNILAVGLAYAGQACLFNLPADTHDQRLDWVITPKGTHYYGH
jgi:5-formyltetrahydrofolate cyclo-ligase